MNVYKRPLFMQQGGAPRMPVPTPPAAMPTPRAPSSAMAPMRPAAAPMRPAPAPMARPQPGPAPDASGIASMVSEKAKMDLDQAQGPEQLINAFRGNQKPLQARYQELAQYVGPQDATATPVSVLTMVQPSLMMTAEGAAESGIGELMAGVASKVPMESAPGAPNRMGQGLGNIMMSRQAPQPAGMAQGGAVKKFQSGGSALVDYYKEDLPAFQEILASSQEDKDAAKRQLFFDIAQRGLAMAGGAGGTGNVASQLANVFQTLPGTYAAQQAELRKGDRAAQQAALQSAVGRVGADREATAARAQAEREAQLKREEQNTDFIYKLTLQRDEAMNKGLDFTGIVAYASDGVTQLDVLNAESPTFDADRAAILENNPGAQFFKIGDLKDLQTESSAPTFSAAAANAVFNRSDLRQSLLSGQTPISAEDLDTVNQAILINTRPKFRRVQNPITLQNEDILVPQRLTTSWENAVVAAANRGLNIQVPDYLQS